MSLSQEDAARFLKRAKYAATKYGFSEHSDDFAQDVLLKYAEGRGRHQTVDQAVIDAIRERFGRPGLPGYSKRYALATAYPIDEMREDAIGTPARGSEGNGIDFDRLVRRLSPRDREVIELRFRDGYTELEIGEQLGFSESRASQIIKAILERLRRQLKAEDGRMFEMEMETRICTCGCGLAFRCMKTSSQTFASQQCQASVTPGGMAELLKHTKRKTAVKELPENVSGIVGSAELAKTLGVSYQSIYLWTKSGRIVPLDEPGRNKRYDLADVRRRLTASKRSETTEVRGIPEVRKEAIVAMEAPRIIMEEKSVENTRKVDSPVSADTPERAAFRAYRVALNKRLSAVRSDGDEKQELALLRQMVGLNRKKFEQAIAGLCA